MLEKTIFHSCVYSEYTRSFMEDGVDGNEILSLLTELEEDMQEIGQGATGAIRQEIEEIRWIIESARKMVQSTYRISQ